MNLGSAPSRILGCQGSDEIAKLRGDRRPARTGASKEAPVAAETGAMPAHDGLRFHDHQRARPFRPPTPEAQPEETIAKPQLGSGVLTCLRTPTCCRKATSSSPRSCRERKKAPNRSSAATPRRSRLPFFSKEWLTRTGSGHSLGGTCPDLAASWRSSAATRPTPASRSVPGSWRKARARAICLAPRHLRFHHQPLLLSALAGGLPSGGSRLRHN